jgi:hypothetical protein
MRLKKSLYVIKLVCALCWIIFVLVDIVGLMNNPENYIRAYRITESNPVWYQTSTTRFVVKLIIEGSMVLNYLALILMKQRQSRLSSSWYIGLIEVILLIFIYQTG